MLKGITWQQFLPILGGLLGVYYLLLFVKYGIRGIGKAKNTPAEPPFNNDKTPKRIWRVEEQEDTESALMSDQGTRASVPDEENSPAEELAPAEEEKAFENLEMLAADIQKIISQSETGIDKATLLSQIQQEISRYPMLNRRAFKVAIGNLIIRQAEQYCKLVISLGETEHLWSHF